MPYADYQEHLENNRRYAKTPDGKIARVKANRDYRRRKSDRLRAHNAVAKAVAKGALSPWPVCAVPDCSCTKVEGHHPDYSAPLSVVWLCDQHHKEAHRIAKQPTNATK